MSWRRKTAVVLRRTIRRRSFSIAVKIAGIYILCGALWILLTDELLALTVLNRRTTVFLSVIKGWIYVIFTGATIFLLIYKYLGKTDIAEQQLRRKLKELQTYKDRLESIAYMDDLTGLPNRRAFIRDFRAHISDRPEKRKALIFVDADNIKYVNDTMGHAFGDLLIREIAKRLSDTFDNQLVYRLSGDEFIIFCDNFESPDNVADCAERVLQCFERPFEIGNSAIYSTVSIGISTYPDDGSDPEKLMQCADIAVYKAKSQGKNRYVFFRHAMHTDISDRVEIEKQLRSALEKNEFTLYYQPQIDIKTKKIVGFEALLRWSNPMLGLVPPAQFIGIAEETHIIIPIGAWVLRNACLFLKRLQAMGHDDLTVSVNVSIIELVQEDFIDTVSRILELIALPPHCLELEITESVLIESFPVIIDKLYRLKKMGIKIALDDFGKGYSSFNYLKQLPIDTLKIDKSFIDSINGSESENDSEFSDANLTSAIIMIGRKMGLTILAEGVERREQADFLERNGCDLIQGYLISEPLPFEKAVRFVEEQKRSGVQL